MDFTQHYSLVSNITLSSLDGNPFIWRSHRPRGYLFILAGSLGGVCCLILLAWYSIISYISQREAKLALYNERNRYLFDKNSSSSEDSPLEDPLFVSGQNPNESNNVDQVLPSKETQDSGYLFNKETPQKTSSERAKRKKTPSMHLDELIYGE